MTKRRHVLPKSYTAARRKHNMGADAVVPVHTILADDDPAPCWILNHGRGRFSYTARAVPGFDKAAELYHRLLTQYTRTTGEQWASRIEKTFKAPSARRVRCLAIIRAALPPSEPQALPVDDV